MNKTRWASLAMIAGILVVATGCPPIEFGDPGPPPPTVTQLIAIGAHHTCAQNGRIFCWGDNAEGQLGNGTTTDSTTPVEVPGITWAHSLSAGGDRTCAIAGVDSNVFCWGDNSTGGLGDGTTINRSSPTEIPGMIDMSSVSVGEDFTCATGVGGVRCWGQVPGVAGGFTATPVAIPGWETANRVTVGRNHVCASTAVSQGQNVYLTSVQCLGDNTHGQLGDGTTTSSATPVTVAALSGLTLPGTTTVVGVDSVTAGGDHTCAASNALGTFWCWGDNGSGQLGDGTTTDSSTPVAVPFPVPTNSADLYSGVPSLALGDQFTCMTFPGSAAVNATTVTNSVFGCWGDNSLGQLGDGTNTSRLTYRTNPTDIEAGELYAGATDACEFGAPFTLKQYVRCWGDNSDGQIGDGTTAPRSAPVTITAAYSSQPPAVKPDNPAPKVTFTVTPKVPTAGQPVTFSLHITHPVGIISESTVLRVEQGTQLPAVWGCGDDHAVTTGTATDMTITISCTLPADSPLWATDNGTGLWSFSANVRAIDSPAYTNTWAFYIHATSTDNDGPARIDRSISPPAPTPGQTVVFTSHYTEPHGPVSVVSFQPGAADWVCGTPTVDGSAAPVWGVSVTCVAGAPFAPGYGPFITIADGFGFQSFDYWLPNG